MAIKANASSTGGDFKKFVGVGSFRVLGVNPTKEQLEKFFGREVQNEPEYLKNKTDDKDGGKAYKQLRVNFMVQADDPAHVDEKNKATKECNAALTEPLKTTVSFFIDSRYNYKGDKSKVQVVDKFGRFAWVTIEQCKNHQIPVYKNGPAKLDAGYRPAYRGEESLTEFILNYLNVTPIDSWNKNTGEWITNPHPEDCEGQLYRIKDYFNGDISELKEFCEMIPTNCVKLLMGVDSDDQGKQFNNVYTKKCLRNGSKSYTSLKDAVDGDKKYAEDHGYSFNAVYSNDPIGTIENIQEYKDTVKETDLSEPAESQDPFAVAAALPEDDLPFGESSDEDPFANIQ